MERNTIFFDLEGPLAPQDNAYELMKSIPKGGAVFERISRYDDLLTLEGKTDYEPGDTLALIVPFLIFHHIKEEYISKLAEQSPLTPGAAELVHHLLRDGWNVYCISTSYSQYAMRITEKAGIPPQNVACTYFPLDQLFAQTDLSELKELETVERRLLSLDLSDDNSLKKLLDRFFWLQPTPVVSKIIKQIKPVGGNRKVVAIRKFLSHRGIPLKYVAAVGDSITDCRMLETVRNSGGLAIAFNANEYALPCANAGLASTHLSDLLYILNSWKENGLDRTTEVIQSGKIHIPENDRNYFHFLAQQQDLSSILQIHKRIRRIVRSEAAKLG